MSAPRITEFLHHWQDLSGAIIGGLMGVAGALIVARNALDRERRNASRMLQHDLLGLTDAVSRLTYSRKVSLETVGAERIAEDLLFYRPKLSPLFDAQMAVISGADLRLATLLSGFRTAHSALASCAQNVQRTGRNAPWGIPARVALVATLQSADDCARAALYLLPLQELGTGCRAYRRLRRRAWPDAEDRLLQALVTKLTSAKLQGPEQPETPKAS